VHITATLQVIEAALSRHNTAAAVAAAAAAMVSTDHSSIATSSSSSSSAALQDSITVAHAMAVAMSTQLREGSSSAVQAFHTSNRCGMMAVARHTSTLPRDAVLAILQQLQNSGHPLAALDLAVATAAADWMQQRNGERSTSSSSAHSSISVVGTSSSRREVVQWLAEGLRGWSTTAATSTSLQQTSITTHTSSSTSTNSSSSSSGSSSVCDSAVKLRLHLLQLVVHGAAGLAEAAIEAAVAVGDAPYVQALQLAAESAAEDTVKARNATSGMQLQYFLELLYVHYLEYILHKWQYCITAYSAAHNMQLTHLHTIDVKSDLSIV
jgi:hypothetical protein